MNNNLNDEDLFRLKNLCAKEICTVLAQLLRIIYEEFPLKQRSQEAVMSSWQALNSSRSLQSRKESAKFSSQCLARCSITESRQLSKIHFQIISDVMDALIELDNAIDASDGKVCGNAFGKAIEKLTNANANLLRKSF